MALVRIAVALLVLLQPLPALGLPALLPCPQRCSHCAASRPALPAPDDCGCGAAESPPGAPCSCAHEAPQPVPYAPSCGPGLAGLDALQWADAAPAPQPAPRRASGHNLHSGGLGHDPPPSLDRLCVWRN